MDAADGTNSKAHIHEANINKHIHITWGAPLRVIQKTQAVLELHPRWSGKLIQILYVDVDNDKERKDESEDREHNHDDDDDYYHSYYYYLL